MFDYLRDLPIVDVHEHHLPEVYSADHVGLLDLLRQSYAGWTQARPYPLPSESREEDPMLAASGTVTWEDIRPFLEDSGSNSFVRNLLSGLDELYDLRGEPITQQNWQSLDEEIRRRHSDGNWTAKILEQAGVTAVITDIYSDPLLNAADAFGDNYRSVMRVNALAMGCQRDRTDHNGNSAFEFAIRLNQASDSFDDYCRFLEYLVSTLSERKQVALKNALAYDRDICFDEPNERLARRAYRNENATDEEIRAFENFVVDRLCRLAGEYDVPVQMHLGTALIRGSHPLGVAPLIERHPRTRFLLMHLAYPWSSELLAMAFVYRNIWIDLTWSFLLSPSHFERALHEAIELLPDEHRMMVGGDNWHAEETFATFQTFRQRFAKVLRAKCEDRYFAPTDAERLARRVTSENAKRFFGFPASE